MGGAALTGGDLTVGAGDVAAAVEQLRDRGVVVMPGLVPAPLVAALATASAEVLDDCRASRTGDAWYQLSERYRAVFWERAGRWRVFPKLHEPFDDPGLLAHPVVLDVVERTLGRGFRSGFVSSDTAEPGASAERPNRSLAAAGSPPAKVVVAHVALGASGPDDGPLEVWPGRSHRWPADAFRSIGIPDDVEDRPNPRMEDFASRLVSVRPSVRPGDVVLRDAGLLHRWAANGGTSATSMVAIAYVRAGHTHDFLTAVGNLQRPRPEDLDPRVRPLFAQP